MYLSGNTSVAEAEAEMDSANNPNKGMVKISDNFTNLLYQISTLVSVDEDIKKVTYKVLPMPYQPIYIVDKEIPIGVVNGVNDKFLLKYKPITVSDHIYLNGMLQENGKECDYILENKNIIFLDPPTPGMRIICSYKI
jgi:hypothetical protein